MDIKQIRQRIMCEAYDLADRGDHEGYNAIKVMCSDVLKSIAVVIAAEREACAKVCEERQEVFEKYYTKGLAAMCAEAIRARSKQ